MILMVNEVLCYKILTSLSRFVDRFISLDDMDERRILVFLFIKALSP